MWMMDKDSESREQRQTKTKFSLRAGAEAPPELPIMRRITINKPSLRSLSAEPFGENKMRDIFRMRFRIVFPLKIVTFAANINPDQR